MSIAQKIASGFNSNGILVGANEYAYTKRRNLLDNGDMSIAQRDVGTVASIGSTGLYTLDRWRLVTNGDEVLSMLQEANAAIQLITEFQECLRFDVTTADTALAAGVYVSINQSLIAKDVGHRIAHGTARSPQLTLSFWVKATKTGTNIAELKNQDNARFCSQAYTISAADTWEFKTLTFPGDTGGSVSPNDDGEHFQIKFWLGAGTNFTSGTLGTTWHATSANRVVGQVNHLDSTSNDFSITGVQLELGNVATPFEHLNRGVSREECRQYYQKSYQYTDPAGTVTNTGAIYSRYNATVTNRAGLGVRLVPVMAVDPTVVIYSLNGTSGNVSDCDGNYVHTADDTVTVNSTATSINKFNLGTGHNNIVGFHYTADVGF